MTWCDRCDWNVDPSPPEKKYGLLEGRRRKLAQRHGEKLLAEVTGGGSLSPHRSASSVAAFVLALAVHAFTLGVIVAGVCFLVRGWATAWMVPGVVSLALAWTLLPRFGRLPEGDPVLRRAEAPELFALIDEVGAATGTRGVDVVVLNTTVKVCVTTYGLRGRRPLMIGLPFRETLSPRERLALLGHELGHFSNGDTRHGAVVATAFRSLSTLLLYVAPEPDPTPMQALINALAVIPRALVIGVVVVLDLLTLRASQRAEYLADRKGAHAGSTAAAVSLTDRLPVVESVEGALLREANTRQLARRDSLGAKQPWLGLWERLAAHLESIPPREYERLRRVGALRGHSSDSTHPPTHLRRASLLSGPPTEAAVLTDEAREQRIASELADVRMALARRVFTYGLAG
ncbi:M48 family metallopeptidase [Streptomyces sp. NPDC060198]|uniref:M48 family metallopeptidase n=1 Tax=Streptomyces sp. NPDC060198 TaxID=3347070 RepID=UPI00365B1F92